LSQRNPCVRGNCTDGVNGYTCDCLVGFTGSKCETNIDDCHNKPCVHGNCTDGVNGYTCDCHIGFTGSKCETNIDDCHSKPCVHGNCTDGVKNYTCVYSICTVSVTTWLAVTIIDICVTFRPSKSNMAVTGIIVYSICTVSVNT
jgi:hypothetical protein